MLLTPHTVVGVAIATSVPNPYIAVPLSFLMHFVGDKVPHWDFFSDLNQKEDILSWRIIAIMADLIVAVGVGLTFTLHTLWVVKDSALAINIFLCGIASVLPDVVTAFDLWLGRLPKVIQIIPKIQRKVQSQTTVPFGTFTQIVVIGVSIYLILSSTK